MGNFFVVVVYWLPVSYADVGGWQLEGPAENALQHLKAGDVGVDGELPVLLLTPVSPSCPDPDCLLLVLEQRGHGQYIPSIAAVWHYSHLAMGLEIYTSQLDGLITLFKRLLNNQRGC